MRAANRHDLQGLKGRRVQRGMLGMRWQETGEELAVAYALTAKGTTAVRRNRLRRQLRAAIREVLGDKATGTLLISARADRDAEYAELKHDLEQGWRALQRNRRT